MTEFVRLTRQERDEIDRMRFHRNLWGAKGERSKWFMPETRRGGSVEACEALVEKGFALSSHKELSGRNIISRLINAIFFPSGIAHRYAITQAGLDYANKYIENLNP